MFVWMDCGASVKTQKWQNLIKFEIQILNLQTIWNERIMGREEIRNGICIKIDSHWKHLDINMCEKRTRRAALWIARWFYFW